MGREALSRGLVDRVVAPAGSGLVMVVGPSGSCMSSLLRAGLMATLALTSVSVQRGTAKSTMDRAALMPRWPIALRRIRSWLIPVTLLRR